jgi:ArsR family transcriptional regulator
MKCPCVDFEKVAEIFGALSSDKRLQIIDLLRDSPKTVTQLAQEVGCKPPCVSQHLSVLKNQGVVGSARDGHEVFYSLKMNCVLDFIDCLIGKNCICKEVKK